MIGDGDPELAQLVDQLRRCGFLPLGVPVGTTLLDEGLVRHRGDVADLLIVPRYGDATVLRTQVVNDPNHPGDLVHSVLVRSHSAPLVAARLLLDLLAVDGGTGDQAVS